MLGNRIKIASKEIGGIDALAAITGIPRTTLYGYSNNRHEPKSSQLADIANATNVTLDWLVFGKGPMRPEDATPEPTSAKNAQVAPIDEALFQQVSKLVKRVHQEENITLPADAIMSATARYYNELIELPTAPQNTEELLLLLPWLENKLRKDIRHASENLGSGKHSA